MALEDLGFNGTGSRFNGRFESGSPILAKQLNDLAAGLQASLPMPYLGEGSSVSYLPGGSLITSNTSAVYVQPNAWTPSISGETAVIYPGTINGLTPTIDETPLTDIPAPVLTLSYSGGSDGYSYIYADAASSGSTYPVDAPTIISSASQLTSTNTNGYLLLATIYKDATTGGVTVWQYVKSSLWTDRIKVGSATAKYYWGAV
jgi:hypothetical protein